MKNSRTRSGSRPRIYRFLIFQKQHNRIKNHNWQKATSWLFTSMAEDLYSGRKNKSSKSPERDSNPGPPDCESDVLRPLGHAASIKVYVSLTVRQIRIYYFSG